MTLFFIESSLKHGMSV